MSICPICNGFQSLVLSCQKCSFQLVDEGKMSDFYDDYSPYMEIDLMKLEDGYPENFATEKCVHLLRCSSCGEEQVYFVQE